MSCIDIPQATIRQQTVWITEEQSKTRKGSFSSNYTKLKQIGEAGSYGTAFQCQRKADGQRMAVKEISKTTIYRTTLSDASRKATLQAMKAEIDVMSRLKHPYIVNMHETFETKHKLHIIMEECKGGELFDRIKQKRRYTERDAKPIIRMLCEALFYMHHKHKVVHCDLKPDNILFVDHTHNSDIKIIDFGMSQILPRLQSLNQLCGTPYYTAPEIIKGEYTHSADMWSVGVIAYVMIFGFPPFYVNPDKYHGIRETKAIYKAICKGFDGRVQKGYGAWFPFSLSRLLSKDGRDFVAHLMEKDVAKRLSAKEALQHPWLTRMDCPCDSGGEYKLNGLEFANFAVSHKFKYAISGLFREQYKNMRPKHFENLKRLFGEMDLDGNGSISYHEFEEGMLKCKELKLDKNKMKKMFGELDVGNAGEIEFNGLLDAVVHDYLVESDVRLYEAFHDLDEDETGNIATDVLKKKIREMNVYDNIENILQIIDDVDLDNDGSIDYNEFLRALHPDFNETPNWFWSRGDENKESDGYEDYIESIEEMQVQLDMKGIAKQGWMRKEGKYIKSWKRRYFVLQNNGVMSYYHHEKEEVPIARFNCKHLTKLSNKSWGQTNEKRYGIKVYTPHRNWKFLCQNNIERKEWSTCLQSVSKYNKDS